MNLTNWLDGGWMHTYTGRRFYPLRPNISDIHIVDIAHALSRICRFGGHSEQHYSVAQHSVLVSWHCDPEVALWGLLHDAAEAYVGDMIRPIKHQSGMEVYRQAEGLVQNAVCAKFGLRYTMPPSVRLADRAVLATEGRDVRNLSGKMEDLPDPLKGRIIPWSSKLAKEMFLERAKELGVDVAT